MTYQNSITNLLSLLYQERKLIAYVYEAKSEKRIFTAAELLPLCQGNGERLERLIHHGILQERLGKYELKTSVFEFLALSLGELSTSRYLQFELDAFQDYLQHLPENSSPLSVSTQLSSAVRKLEQGLSDAWKDYEKHPDSEKKEALQKMIRNMRSMIWEDDKIEVYKQEELESLLIHLEELMKEVVQKLKENKYERTQVPATALLQQRINHLKDLQAQGKTLAYSNLQVLLEDQPAIWLESPVISRPRIATSQLYQAQALGILQRIHNKKKKNIPIPDTSLPNSLPQVEKGDVPRWDLHAFKKSFEATDKDLFIFIQEYDFPQEITAAEKLSLFLQLVDQFGSEWNQTQTHSTYDGVQYLQIFSKH